MPIIDLFVYGTLRTEYANGRMIRDIAPAHVLSGEAGSWRVDDYGLFCSIDRDGRPSIPAVASTSGLHVVGDVVRVNAADFTELCRYESFPSLYELHGVECWTPGALGGRHYRQVFMFVPPDHNRAMFPFHLSSGDFIASIDEYDQMRSALARDHF